MADQRKQLGIFSNTFRQPTIEGVIDAVKGHGLEKIEFNFSCIDMLKVPGTDTLPSEEKVDESIIKRIRTATEERSIEMVSIAGYFNMIHPDVETRKNGVKQLGILMKSARELDINLVTLCTGSRDPEQMWRKHPSNTEKDAYEDILVSMGEALELAEENDMTLAFEPEVNLVIDSPRKTRRFLDDIKSPRLKVIFDSANIFPFGGFERMTEIMTESVEMLADDIVLVHAKDVTAENEAGDVCAGKGRLDYDLYMKLLRKINFKGPILFHSLTEDEVDGCIEHVTKYMN